MKSRYTRSRASIAVLAIALAAGLSLSNPSTNIECNPTDLAGSSITTSPGDIRYRVDAGQSRFIVWAFVGGLFSAFGHDHTIAIRDFTGEAQLTPVTFEPASLQLTIKADSLSVTDKVSDSDRQEIESTMRNEVLETSKHPEIVFKSTNVNANKLSEGRYRLKITGDLDLHGVTRSVVINADVSLLANSLRARGQFSLRHSDYNIKRVSVAGGTIKVKEELKFNFDIVAPQR